MAIATLSIDLVAKLATLERDMGRAAGIAERNAKRMDDAFKGFESTLKGLAGALSVSAFVGWVSGAVNAAEEVGKLAQLSNAGTEEFQRYAAGAKTVGFESEKLADIFKDVNDKVGDFLATGGGPLKDFFDEVAPKVGIAAESFKNLSGPQALQLYFDSLEKANVGQQRLTFFMEAIANDATALVPLLRDNGAEFKRIGDEAERLGIIFDDKLIRSAKEFNENLDRLTGLSRSVAAEIGNAVIPTLNRLAEEFLDARRAGLSFFEALSGLGTADPSKSAAQQVERVKGEIAELQEELNKPRVFQSLVTNLIGPERLEQLQKELEYWQLQAQRQFKREFVGPERFTLPSSGGSGAGGSGAGGSGSGTRRTGRTELDPLADAAKAYEAALNSLTRAQIVADTSGLELTATQQDLLRVMTSPEWLRMPETWRATIAEQGEATIAAEKFADTQKRLNALIDATPTAKLEEQRNTMQFLADAFLRGAINAAQFNEAALTALGEIDDQANKTVSAIDEFAKSAAQNIQSTLADFLFDPFADGLDGMAANFGRVIQRMIADAVAADLAKRLFGDLVEGGAGDGWIGQALGGITALFAANGHAFTGYGTVKGFANGGAFGLGTVLNSPTPFMFADGGSFGLGIAGEAGPEAALPLKRMADGKLGVLTESGRNSPINITVNVVSGTPDEVRRAAGAGARDALAVMTRARRYA